MAARTLDAWFRGRVADVAAHATVRMMMDVIRAARRDRVVKKLAQQAARRRRGQKRHDRRIGG